MNKGIHSTGGAENLAQRDLVERVENLLELGGEIGNLCCAISLLDDLLEFELGATSGLNGPFPYQLTACRAENPHNLADHLRQLAFHLERKFDLAVVGKAGDV